MKNDKWARLDNAAKIFPSASSKSDSQVFRFSCRLKEPVVPELLQQALEDTIKLFPVYRSVMKRGMFWYYLEMSDIQPEVREEWNSPCTGIYNKNVRSLLFEVTYYQTRINLEVYHVLSDGTGAMQFLRSIATRYLVLKNHLPERVTADVDASYGQKWDDSFDKYYSKDEKIKKKKAEKAYRLTGNRFLEHKMKVIEGSMPVKLVLQEAHRLQTTLTAYITACLIQAIGREMTARARKHPIRIAVPVNLRNYFESESVRNFFSLIFVEYDLKKGNGELEDIVRKVDEGLKQELTQENMRKKLNEFTSIEHNPFARIAPLFLKDISLKAAYHISARNHTATVSNLGIVRMPPEVERDILSFQVCNSTNKLQICMNSYQDVLTVSFASPFQNTDIQRRFFRGLTGIGIPVEITTNRIDEE